MPFQESSAPTLDVDDVLGFNDAELVEFMKRNRDPEGGFDLGNIRGWDTLPKDRRDLLAARLKFGAQQADDETPSRPVDLDQVAAKLLEFANGGKPSQLPPSASRRERGQTEEADFDAESKTAETIAYNNLINDGGCPAYPIQLLDDVTQNPVAYSETLRPWQGGWPDTDPPRWDRVFQEQWERWQLFRDWQQDNRGLVDDEKEFALFVIKDNKRREEDEVYQAELSDEDKLALARRDRQDLEWKMSDYQKLSGRTSVDFEDEGFLAFVEKKRQQDLKQGLTWAAKTEEEYTQALRNDFNEKKARRYRLNFYWLREDHGRGKFPAYVDEAKRRLPRHGYTRPFQFDEDPNRQDKFTTWIEYFNFECSWYDKHTRAVESTRPRHDAAWKKLEDSGVLKPGETSENLATMESSQEQQTEIDQATMALKSAEASAEAALNETEKANLDPQSSRFTKEQRIRRLKAANSRLAAAQASFDSTKRRSDLISDFIRGTHMYRAHKMSVRNHTILLEWIREKIPLVEAESKQSKTVSSSSHTGRVESEHQQGDEASSEPRRTTQSKRSSKRGRSDDPSVDTRPSKRGRTSVKNLGTWGTASASEPKGPAVTETGSEEKIDEAASQAGKASRNLRSQARNTTQRKRPAVIEARGQHKVGEAGTKAGKTASHRRSRPKSVIQPPTTTQPLRRSARIAAFQNSRQTRRPAAARGG